MTSSLVGVSGFLMKRTKGDEWGVYRVNAADDRLMRKPYLMLAFTDVEDAVTYGRRIAQLFGKECKINRSAE